MHRCQCCGGPALAAGRTVVPEHRAALRRPGDRFPRLNFRMRWRPYPHADPDALPRGPRRLSLHCYPLRAAVAEPGATDSGVGKVGLPPMPRC